MKITYFIILISIIWTNLCYLQQRAPDREVFVGTTGVGASDTIIFKMEAADDVWVKPYGETDIWDLSTVFDTASWTVIGVNDTNNINNWSGFSWKDDGSTNAGWEYSWGLYKLSPYTPDGSAHTDMYFYLDFRDEEYPDYDDFTGGHVTDIWVLYDYDLAGDSAVFQIANDHSPFDLTISTPGQVVTIWSLKESTNTICLEIITDEGDNPILQWHPDPKFDGASYYEVYRAESTTPSKPALLSYSKIHTTSDNDTMRYVDIDIDLSETGDYIYYYVKKNSGSKSNYVNTRGLVSKRSNAENRTSELINSLDQNHPNPFNPVTNINYSIAKKSYVKLIVYNSLGQVVSVLIDAAQGEGYYSVPFNARNLNSGIYFYKLETDYFSDVKKMIVTK